MSHLPFDPGTAGHGPPSQKRVEAYRRRQRIARENRMNRLADLIANGMSVSAAARNMGLAQQTGSALFRDMCERLGPQALGDWYTPWP